MNPVDDTEKSGRPEPTNLTIHDLDFSEPDSFLKKIYRLCAATASIFFDVLWMFIFGCTILIGGGAQATEDIVRQRLKCTILIA